MTIDKPSTEVLCISVAPPLYRKPFLTLDEAADFFPIGKNKIRTICERNPNLGIRNGNRLIINRIAFEHYLMNITNI